MQSPVEKSPGDLIAVAAIIFGFGITVFVFRIQREVSVQEKDWPTWLPWSDLLIISSVLVAASAILPLIVLPHISVAQIAWASSACVAALLLQIGYIPAILAHYRIGFGSKRTGPRERGEPAERAFVWTTGIVAAMGLVFVLSQYFRS